MSPRRRALRDALVLFHVLAVFVLAFPAPTGARQDSTWRDPHLRSELQGWVKMLNAAGWAVTAPELVEIARGLATAALDVRDLAIAPFLPYATVCGTGQGWQMFASLNDEPARLSVQIRRGGGDWEPLYIARDPAAAWRGPQLDQERTRAVINDWSWAKNRSDYRLFSAWLARQAARDFPDADAIQVSMLRARLPTPEQLIAGAIPAEKPTWVEPIPLGPLRTGDP